LGCVVKLTYLNRILNYDFLVLSVCSICILCWMSTKADFPRWIHLDKVKVPWLVNRRSHDWPSCHIFARLWRGLHCNVSERIWTVNLSTWHCQIVFFVASVHVDKRWMSLIQTSFHITTLRMNTFVTAITKSNKFYKTHIDRMYILQSFLTFVIFSC